jgi:hypothetical protein
MSWLNTQPRLTQCYVATVAALNRCGIKPDGAVIKPYLVEDLDKVTPPVTKFEIEMVLVGMVTEKVQFHGEPDSGDRFAAEPVFAGSHLGKLSQASGEANG